MNKETDAIASAISPSPNSIPFGVVKFFILLFLPFLFYLPPGQPQLADKLLQNNSHQYLIYRFDIGNDRGPLLAELLSDILGS